MFGITSKSFSPNLVDNSTKANPAPRHDKYAFSLLLALSSSGALFSTAFEAFWKDR
jgi:hypothetical protein